MSIISIISVYFSSWFMVLRLLQRHFMHFPFSSAVSLALCMALLPKALAHSTYFIIVTAEKHDQNVYGKSVWNSLFPSFDNKIQANCPNAWMHIDVLSLSISTLWAVDVRSDTNNVSSLGFDARAHVKNILFFYEPTCGVSTYYAYVLDMQTAGGHIHSAHVI